ncbi:MAG TPA: hypothetical protein VGD02_11410 [Gemmatimonadaceae bacterium]
MRINLAFCLGVLTLLSRQAVAQSASENAGTKNRSEVAAVSIAAKPDTVVSYDTQALRLESHWGDYRVVKGKDGAVVGTVGLLRSFDVEKLVSRSPVAAAEARVYHANHLPGSIVGALGGVTFIAGLIMSSNSSNNASSPILVIAGAGAIGWSAQHLNTAYSALSRAIWWYNRDLPR